MWAFCIFNNRPRARDAYLCLVYNLLILHILPFNSIVPWLFKTAIFEQRPPFDRNVQFHRKLLDFLTLDEEKLSKS